jgi:hypothetical protein
MYAMNILDHDEPFLGEEMIYFRVDESLKCASSHSCIIEYGDYNWLQYSSEGAALHHSSDRHFREQSHFLSYLCTAVRLAVGRIGL